MNTAVSEKPFADKGLGAQGCDAQRCFTAFAGCPAVSIILDCCYIAKNGAGDLPRSTTLWPEVINTASYAAQLEMGDFNMFRSFGNSLTVSLAAMAISVLSGGTRKLRHCPLSLQGKKSGCSRVPCYADAACERAAYAHVYHVP